MIKRLILTALAFLVVWAMVKKAKVFIDGVFDPIIKKMASAIQTFEGYYPGSRSYRNNNPGNLKFAGQSGAIGQDETGHAVFAYYDEGWAALIHQLKLAFYGGSRVYGLQDTLYSFFGKYAEGNTVEYAEFVAGRLGVDPGATLETMRG